MAERYYEDIGEKISTFMLSGGLKCIRIHKPGYRKKFACLSVRFGSAYETFRCRGEEIVLPSGTAHFLEHMVFSADDAYSEFSLNGADANAFTAPDMTCFYFCCGDHFYTNLKALIRAVFYAKFEKESVEKERLVILQELHSCTDEPDYLLCESLMRQILPGNRISQPVIGCDESINAISSTDLSTAYRVFYHPSAMVLSIWGDFTDRDITPELNELPIPNYPADVPAAQPILFIPETRIPKEDVLRNQDVSNPLFMIGASAELHVPPQKRFEIQAGLQMAFSCMFGTSSAFYNMLYKDGVLNAYSPPSLELQLSVLTVTLSGETKNSKIIFEKFKQTLADCDKLVTDHKWEDMRKATYGNMIRALDSEEDEAISVADGELNGFEFLQVFEDIRQMKKEDVLKTFRTYFPESAFQLVTMLPDGGENT